MIPVLAFLFTFFVIKVAIAYAVIYAVLSIVIELIVYSIFFHKNREESDKDNLKEIKLRAESERKEEKKESIRDKTEKNKEYRKEIETLQLSAKINLNDESFKDKMDSAAKKKIVNTLIEDKQEIQ